MRINNIWKLFPIVIFVGIIVFFEWKSSNERTFFYKSDVNSYIVKKKNNWSGGRSYDYQTKNRFTITLMKKDSLEIGDSVSKAVNTSDFKIFRKNRFGKYEFYKNYEINH